MFKPWMFLKSNKSAPKEAGINRLKEKLKASKGDKPISKPANIVEPDRETAGIMAIAWKMPIINDFW